MGDCVLGSRKCPSCGHFGTLEYPVAGETFSIAR